MNSLAHWVHQVYSFWIDFGGGGGGGTWNNAGTVVVIQELELEEPNLSRGTFYDKDKERVSPVILEVSWLRQCWARSKQGHKKGPDFKEWGGVQSRADNHIHQPFYPKLYSP